MKYPCGVLGRVPEIKPDYLIDLDNLTEDL